MPLATVKLLQNAKCKMRSSKNRSINLLADSEQDAFIEKCCLDLTGSTDKCSPESQKQAKDAVPQKQSEQASFSFRQMLRYAQKFDYFLLVTGIFFSILYGAMPSSSTIIFRGLTNTLMTAESQLKTSKIDMEWFTNELLRYICLYALAMTISLVSGYLSMYCLFILCERQIFVIRQHFFKSLLDQSIEFFEQNEVGKLTQKTSLGIDKIRDGTTDKLVLVISSVTSLIAGISVSFYISPQMGLLMLCVVPFIVLNFFGSAFLLRSPMKKELAALGRAGSLAENVLSRVKTVLGFCTQSAEVERYNKHLTEAHKYGLRKAFVVPFFTGTFQMVVFASMSVAFWYGTNLLISGSIGPGDVICSFWAAFGGAMRIGSTIPHIAVIVGAKIAAAEVFEIIDQRSKNKQPKSKDQMVSTKLHGHVEFSDVSFSYPTRSSVRALSGLTFEAEPGKTLALVGRSGSGKTTIVNLLMKHYQATEGAIKVDGIPIERLSNEELRRAIAIVPQQPVIFSLTVEENLKLDRLNITDQDIIAACDLANASEFINKLPKGYQTPIVNGQLSGGEAQRLTIARALLASPKILILDEPSSALDPNSEQQIKAAIEKISVNRTVIIITHHLPVTNANQILVLNQGQLAEKGTHDELIQNKGLYYQLVNTYQQGDSYNDVSADQNFMSEQSKRPLDSCVQSLSSDLDLSDDDDKINEEAVKKKRIPFVRILQFARPEYKFLVPGLLITILRGFSWPAFSVIYGRLFKSLSSKLTDKSEGMPLTQVSEFLLLGFVVGTLAFFGGYLLGITGIKLTRRIRSQLFSKLLRQDGAFFDNPRNSTGKLTFRLSNDASSVAAAIDQRLADILQGLVSLVCGAIIAFLFDYKMGAASIVVPFLVFAGQLFLTNALKRQVRQDTEAAAETARIANEAISQIRTVHSMNAQQFFYNLYCSSARQLYFKAKHRARLQAASFGLMGAYFSLSFMTAYAFGLLLIRAGHSSPFSVFQAIESTNMSAFSVILVATFFSDYLRAQVSANLIFKLMDEETEIDGMSTGGSTPQINGNISFKNVSFSYPNADRQILKNMSFEIKSGQRLTLVGPSGQGKSTVAQLLKRFYDVTDGCIKIEGVDIRQISISHLRSSIALVEQQPTLFNLSIADNIAYGRPDAVLDDIVDAAKRTNIHSTIVSLPDGYNTLMKEQSALSGGQMQRLVLARALLNKSKVLLLDEVNSGLDPENEKIIQETLDAEAKHRTCIVISHRLNSIRSGDLIAVVSDGQVVEVGTHDELIKHDGVYSRLSKESTKDAL